MPYASHIKVHLCQNVDGTYIAETLKRIDFETTLILRSPRPLPHKKIRQMHTAKAHFLEVSKGRSAYQKAFCNYPRMQKPWLTLALIRKHV